MDFKILIALEGNTYTENALPFVSNIVLLHIRTVNFGVEYYILQGA